MKKIIIIFALALFALIFFACKTEAGSSSTDSGKTWKVTINEHGGTGLNTTVYDVQNGDTLKQSQLEGTSTVMYMKLSGYKSGDADFVLDETKVYNDMTITTQWAKDTSITCPATIDPTQLLSYALDGETLSVACALSNTSVGIDDKNEYGFTALTNATSNGHIDIVKYLIANNANIQNKTKEGYTAFLSSTGNLDILKLLLANGANLTDRANDGRTAFLLASGNSNLEVLQYLVEHGANLGDVDTTGKTALFWAANYERLDNVKYLVGKGANINSTDNNGNTALLWAIYKAKLPIVQYMLANGANINDRNTAGESAIILGTKSGILAIVTYLVETAKVNVNEVDATGSTALIWAAQLGFVDIVKYLGEIPGVNVSLSTTGGKYPNMTALQIANQLYTAYQTQNYKDIADYLATK